MSKFYRVITFQSKEVIDTILQSEVYFADEDKLREGSICQEDIDACNGKTPIWVFQHPAFCFDKIGDKQWCDMLETFRCEMSIDSLNDFYMIELHLNYQPPIGKAHNSSSLACVIPSIKLNDVAGIYKLNQTKFYFYDIIPYKLYSSNCLFSDIYRFNKDDYKNDNLPTLSLSKFKNDKEYYDYEKVRYVYVLSIVGNKRLDLFIDDIIKTLPNRELGLVELYEEVTKIIRTKQEKNTYMLEDCTHDITITTQSNIDSNHCAKNANALGILNTYKNKYNISDAMWVSELERLQVLCDSTDIHAVADFIETNFL